MGAAGNFFYFRDMNENLYGGPVVHLFTVFILDVGVSFLAGWRHFQTLFKIFSAARRIFETNITQMDRWTCLQKTVSFTEWGL